MAQLEKVDVATGAGDTTTSSEVEQPLVSVVIPTFNKWKYTEKCLAALKANTEYSNFEIIVVDNASSDETPARLESLGDEIHLRLNPQNEGFARGCNQGAAMARGEHILFLNNDTEPRAGWMTALVEVLAEQPDVAAVGSQLLFPDGMLQHAGVLVHYGEMLPIETTHVAYHRPPAEGPQEVTDFHCITAACMLIRRDVFEAVGGFEEEYVNGYEDMDLCFKVAERGHRICYTPHSVVVHHESVSEGRYRYAMENCWVLVRRWLGRFTRFDRNFYPEEERTPVAPERPGTTVIVPLYESFPCLFAVLQRLLLHTGAQDEIVVVDRGAGEPELFVAGWLRDQYPERIRLIEAGANPRSDEEVISLSLAQSDRPYAAILSRGLLVTPGWLEVLLGILEDRPEIAMVGPSAELVSGRQEAGLLPLEVPEGVSLDEFAASVRAGEFGIDEVEALMPGCLVVRRPVLDEAIRLEPETFFASCGHRLPQLVRASGHGLAVGRSALVRDMWPPRDKGKISLRTALQRATNSMWEEVRRRMGRDPGLGLWQDNLIKPQTGLASIIVLVWDNLEATKPCLASIFENTLRPFELILVDNGSAPPAAQFIDEMEAHYDNVQVIRNAENQGYPYGCNQGLAAAKGDYLVLLNNDVVVPPSWLSDQIALFGGSKQIGLVGPRTNESAGPQLVPPDEVGYSELAGLRTFARHWAARKELGFTYTDPLTGLCMVLQREVVERIGGLDTNFWIGNLEDNDFCVRLARAGYQMAIAHDVYVHHEGRSTFKAHKIDYDSLIARNWEFFCSKWDFERPLGGGYPTQQLVKGRPFDPSFDRIPPDTTEVFRPGLVPVGIEGRKDTMVLMIPEWDGDEWKKPFSDFVRVIGPDDPIGLVLRVEPPTPRQTEVAVEAVGKALAALNITEDRSPDMVLEATVFSPSQRGRLYASAEALLCAGGSRAKLYEREAGACGMPLLRDLGGEGLRLRIQALRSTQEAEKEPGSTETVANNVTPSRQHDGGPRPGISVVVVTHHNQATIPGCLSRLRALCTPRDQVIVVDNVSGDETRTLLRRWRSDEMPDLDLVFTKLDLGFSRSVNLGLERATCDLVLLLSPTALLTEGSLDALAGHLVADRTVGAVGPTSDGCSGPQNVDSYCGDGPVDPEELAAALREAGVAPVQGMLLGDFCLMMWRQRLVDGGGLDPQLFLGAHDLDLALRVGAEGLNLLVATDVFVPHTGEASGGRSPDERAGYLAQQSANLLYEKLYEMMDGEVPSGQDLWGIDSFAPQTQPLSVVMVIGNDAEATAGCISSLVAGTHRALELVLVARDEPGHIAAHGLVEPQDGVVHLRVPDGTGPSEALNAGLAAASGEYILVCADDVLFPYGTVARLLALLGTDEKRAMVGPRCAFARGAQGLPPGTSDLIEDLQQFAYSCHESEAGYSVGVAVLGDFCMLTRRSVLELIGGVDPLFAPGNYRSMDLSLRLLKAGHQLVLAQDVVVHRSRPSDDVSDDDVAEMTHFAQKWQLAGGSDEPKTIEEIVAKEPFDPETDFVSLEIPVTLHPNVAPLRVEHESAALLLCIPDWEGGNWRGLMAAFISAFEPGEGVGLLVRVEPANPELVQYAVSALETTIADLGVSGGRIPEIVLEATPLASQGRGGLYTAAQALLCDGGAQTDLYAREAAACGLPVIVKPSTENLRSLMRRS